MKKQNVMYSILTRIIKLVLAVIAVLLIYMGALVTYDFGYRIFAEKPMAAGDGKEYIIEIEEGMSTGEVAELLEKDGVIRSALVFQVQNRLSHYKGGFRMGTYTIHTAMTNNEIMAVLSGEVSQE